MSLTLRVRLPLIFPDTCVTLPPGGVRRIVIRIHVCLSVRSHCSKTTAKFCLCTFPVAMARSSSEGVANLRYAMYFRCVDDVRFSKYGVIGPESSTLLCLEEVR